MSVSYRINSVTFSDGTHVPIAPEGITVLVGPNNAGKSMALREIQTHVSGTPNFQPPKVVTSIEAEKSGSLDELKEHLKKNIISQPGNEDQAPVKAPGVQIPMNQVTSAWSSAQPTLGQLMSRFVYFLNADGRTALAGSVGSYDRMNDVPQQPLQFLFADKDLEKQLSKASQDAFGLPLLVNRVSGGQIHLQVGTIEEPTGLPVDDDYIERLRAMPHVSEQGDGVKSFVGIMLGVSALQYPIVIIDEPEAFLHPPQARLLGRKLAELCPKGTQVLVATHSSDILRGLLEANQPETKVVRITRAGTANHAEVVDKGNIETLWSDPLLRYSNILDGLFHRGTILCESESDVTFYSAVLDEWQNANEKIATEFQLTSCGGKHRFPTAIKALRAAGVDVKAVADFDVMRDVQPLQNIVTALGGDWSLFQSDRTQLNNDLSQRQLPPTVASATAAIEQVLSGKPGNLTKELANDIKEIIKIETGWDQCKRSGLAGLTGNTLTTAKRLLQNLAGLGLFVVDKGELEQFYPEGASKHGPAWTIDALANDAHKGADAQKFVDSIIQSF